MGRIKKGILTMDDRPSELGYPDYEGSSQPYRVAHILLVKWLNSALSGSPVEREAARRVGELIEGVLGFGFRPPRSMWHGAEPKSLGTYRLRAIAPYYAFEFDLFPLGPDGKWQLLLHCVYAASGGRHQSREGSNRGEWLELEAAGIVVDLALDGRLAKIKRCQVPDCGKWFVTKRDFRVFCCPEHSSDDLRKGTPERKEQQRAAKKAAGERDKREKERSWEYVGKKKDDKRSSRRARR